MYTTPNCTSQMNTVTDDQSVSKAIIVNWFDRVDQSCAAVLNRVNVAISRRPNRNTNRGPLK